MNRKRQRFATFQQQPRKTSGADRHSSKAADAQGLSADLLMGRNCIEELLKHDPERIREIFISEALGNSPQQARRSTLRLMIEAAGIPIRECGRNELERMVQSDSHQGIIARVRPRIFLSLDELLEQARETESIRILALDGVLDPQNVGAMLRAAECFGVDAVVWSKNRAAPLGPVVSKVSVGASELVPLCLVPNLHRAVEALKEVGVWSIGAVVAPEATELEQFEAPKKWVLVMGSEGEGIQRLIEDNLDFRVYIRMFGKISSLNVSQAAAVMLHALVTVAHGQNHFVKVG